MIAIIFVFNQRAPLIITVDKGKTEFYVAGNTYA